MQAKKLTEQHDKRRLSSADQSHKIAVVRNGSILLLNTLLDEVQH